MASCVDLLIKHSEVQSVVYNGHTGEISYEPLDSCLSNLVGEKQIKCKDQVHISQVEGRKRDWKETRNDFYRIYYNFSIPLFLNLLTILCLY